MYKKNFIIGFIIRLGLTLAAYCYNLLQTYIERANKPIIIEHASAIPYTYLGEFHITHYTHTGNRCKNGYYPTLRTVAVDPNVIPLNSLLYIEGYGIFVAMDTGGAIKGNRVDLCFYTRAECIQFGRRKCRVYVLN